MKEARTVICIPLQQVRGFIQLGALSPFTLVLNTNILKVLDPRLNLDYYKKKKWDKRWIAESKTMVAEIYEKHYRPSVTEASDHSDGDDNDELYQHLYAHNKANKRDELETYLSTPVISGRTDVLQWWKVYKFCHLISFQQRYQDTLPIASRRRISKPCKDGTRLFSHSRYGVGYLYRFSSINIH